MSNELVKMRKVIEVDGWYATDDGRIYSQKASKFLNGRVLKSGYLQVGTNKDGKVKLYRVHRLICRAFHGSPPGEKYTVDHIDFNKLNNRPENLRWATIQDNIEHSLINNRRLRKTTPETAEMIRNEYKAWDRNNSASVLAKKYGLHRSYILAIVKYKNLNYGTRSN